MKLSPIIFILFVSAFIISCSKSESPKKQIDSIAERYVKLVLKAGSHDDIFVDAYYGPEEWRPSENDKSTIEDLIKEADKLSVELTNINTDGFDKSWKLRHSFLTKQFIAVKARLNHVAGNKLTFDEQSKALFDAVSPHNTMEHYENIIKQLDSELPGKGDINKRLDDFRKKLIIPLEKLDTVFRVAIEECKKRTLQHVDLPESESFVLEFVTDKVWGGYNWYKGNYNSLIQINTDLPKYIDGAVDLGGHEGYPGHHVFNALLEKNLTNNKGWVEFSVYPLFSPQSLIAEGSANYGIYVAFPGDEKLKFEKEVLYPLAGLDPSLAEKYEKINQMITKLSYARNDIAREYLDGNISEEEVVERLMKYKLDNRARAEKSLAFIKANESYIINYNLGQDLVKEFIESRAGDSPTKRWEVFKELLSLPYTASTMK